MNVELAKYVGLVAMLADHVGVHVFGVRHPVLEAIGAIALPLFVFAIAVSLRRRPAAVHERVAYRCWLWGTVAQLLLWPVRDPFMLNALFTIGAGVYVASACASRRATWWLVPIVAAGVFVEFSLVGVVFVAATCLCARKQTFVSFAVAALALAALAPFNGSFAALAAIPIFAALWYVPLTIPRLRGAFYFFYCAQWPALLALRAALS